MKRLVSYSLLLVLITLIVSCTTPTTAPEVVTEQIEVTRVVQGEPEVVTEEIEVTRIVEVEVPVSEPTTVPEPVEITFAIGSAPNLINAFIYPAMDLYAPEEGLEIQVVAANGSLDAVKFAVVQRAQFASANVIAGPNLRAQNLPVVDVFDAYQKYDFGIVTLADSGIQSLADLAGKNVGFVSFSSGTYPNLHAMLSAVSLTGDDITPITVGGNGPAALVEGTVDAISSWETQWSGLEAQGVDLRIFRGDEFVNWDGGGIFASEVYIEENPDIVLRFLRALYKGFVYARACPDESFAIVTKYIPEVTDNQDASMQTWIEVTEAAFEGAAVEHGLGYIDLSRRQSQADFLFELGIIESQPDMTPSVNNTFVEQIQEELADWDPGSCQ